MYSIFCMAFMYEFYWNSKHCQNRIFQNIRMSDAWTTKLAIFLLSAWYHRDFGILLPLEKRYAHGAHRCRHPTMAILRRYTPETISARQWIWALCRQLPYQFQIISYSQLFSKFQNVTSYCYAQALVYSCAFGSCGHIKKTNSLIKLKFYLKLK